jgi:hypothetical protein
MHRLKWQSETNEVLKTDADSADSVLTAKDKIIIRLKPMEIRTFVVKFSLVEVA